MTDRSIIAILLIVLVMILQITGWLLGHNGQITILVSNVIVAILAYYFGAKKATSPP